MCARGRIDVAGKYKAVLELSASITDELERYDEDHNTLNEKVLREGIAKSLQGGRIDYKQSDAVEEFSFFKTLTRMIKEEKWWLVASFASFIFTNTIWMLRYPLNMYFVTWSFGPSLGLPFSISVGTSQKSRIFFTLLFSTISAIITLFLHVGSPVSNLLNKA